MHIYTHNTLLLILSDITPNPIDMYKHSKKINKNQKAKQTSVKSRKIMMFENFGAKISLVFKGEKV